MVLGGDIAGKAIQPWRISVAADSRPRSAGTAMRSDDEQELARVERMISDVGYYPWRSEPGSLITG